MKPANDWLKKPLSEKHQTNGSAVSSEVPPVTAVIHCSTQSTPVASDENICSLSMVSVGPYEDFAVSITLCVCCFFSVRILLIFVTFLHDIFRMICVLHEFRFLHRFCLLFACIGM